MRAESRAERSRAGTRHDAAGYHIRRVRFHRSLACAAPGPSGLARSRGGSPAGTGALLAALRAKGETPEEIRGLAAGMRELAVDPGIPPDLGAVDVVGTGGDGSGSLNLSTGSALLAAIEVGHKSVGLSRDWYTAGLSILAVGMVALGTTIARLSKAGKWRVLADPLRYLALLTAGVLMPLTFGWRFIDRDTYDTLHYALTINWWLGGLIFGWGAVHHRSRGLGEIAP